MARKQRRIFIRKQNHLASEEAKTDHDRTRIRNENGQVFLRVWRIDHHDHRGGATARSEQNVSSLHRIAHSSHGRALHHVSGRSAALLHVRFLLLRSNYDVAAHVQISEQYATWEGSVLRQQWTPSLGSRHLEE